MKELTGTIAEWNEHTGRGVILGHDGNQYPFTEKEWDEPNHEPEIDGGVRLICQNGRDASKVEYLAMEHMPSVTTTVYSPQGELIHSESRRFIGGPRRMRSDALAWMNTASSLHAQVGNQTISDISSLLTGEHSLISIRGSALKYCYGFAIELYLKWILTEAGLTYKRNHSLVQLTRKLPVAVLSELRELYAQYCNTHSTTFKMMSTDVHGTTELTLDWSTFDNFVRNIDAQKFILSRYATLEDYSIFLSSSNKLSKEMNSYIDSSDFFDMGDTLLNYQPDLSHYPAHTARHIPKMKYGWITKVRSLCRRCRGLWRG